MQNRIITLLCTFFFSGTIAAQQWYTAPSPTTEDLNECIFTTPDTGFAIGTNGTILMSVNAGESWDSIPSGTHATLSHIDFTHPDTGYISVEDTFYLKSTDGGITWQKRQHSQLKLNSSLCFSCFYNLIHFRGNKGLTIFSDSVFTFARTTDAGKNWQIDSITTNKVASQSISWPAGDTIILASINQYISRSTDGGMTWQEIPVNNSYLSSVYFFDGMRGFLAGTNNLLLPGAAMLLETDDGGQTWDPILDEEYEGRWLSDIDFKNGYGCAVGRGITIHSSDAGHSWNIDTTTFADTTWFFDVKVTDQFEIAVGRDGRIIKRQLSIGNENPPFTNNLKLYPNPVVNTLYLDNIPAIHDESFKIRIYNASGIMLQESDLSSSLPAVDVTDLSPGIYFLNVRYREQLIRSRFIKL